MFTITKQFHFSASHILGMLPTGHPCGRLHGHNYIVEIECRGRVLDERGFVLDYGELEPISDWIKEVLDHRHLNDILPNNPTAENLAQFIYREFGEQFPIMTAVRVSETPKTWAEYRDPKKWAY